MDSNVKPSLEEQIISADTIMFTGAGATDVVNGLPLANHAKNLGIAHKEISFMGLACQWWNSSASAPDYYPIEALENIDQVSDTVVEVTEESTVIRDGEERTPPEVIFVEQFDYYGAVLDANDGVQGIVEGLRSYTKKKDIDLIIHVDCGSDSLYDGKIGSVETPLHDYLMMAAVSEVDTPSIHALTGYGLDGEMSMDALDKTVAKLMQESAYIGAHGITQNDLRDLEIANEYVEDPINSLVIPAARGEHTDKRVFDRQIKVGPLAATILLFDLDSVVNHGPASELKQTKSIEEAEKKLLNQGIVPETKA